MYYFNTTTVHQSGTEELHIFIIKVAVKEINDAEYKIDFIEPLAVSSRFSKLPLVILKSNFDRLIYRRLINIKKKFIKGYLEGRYSGELVIPKTRTWKP